MSLRRALAALILVGAAVLSGCSSTVHLEPAAGANDPICAEVSVALQGTSSVADLDRRWTDAQATAAWGNPVAVILSCGLAAPAPTSELQCVTLEGIDWLVDASETPQLRLTTYGRDPAVQLFIDTSVVSSNDVISNRSIIASISKIPADGKCTAPDELDEDLEDLLS